MRESGDLRYLTCEAIVETRTIVSFITHVILEEFITDQLKCWGLNAQ